MSKFLKMEECKDGYLYLILARNSKLGICWMGGKAFTINREKFGNHFLFDEYHHDASTISGTVRPILELEKAPEFKSDKAKLRWLTKKNTEHKKEIEKLYNFFHNWEEGWPDVVEYMKGENNEGDTINRKG